MGLYDMRREISTARQTLKNADQVADSIAYLLKGRLKHVNQWTLANLKKELKNFNSHTGKWKGEK